MLTKKVLIATVQATSVLESVNFIKIFKKKLYNKYYVDQLEQEKPHTDDRHIRE